MHTIGPLVSATFWNIATFYLICNPFVMATISKTAIESGDYLQHYITCGIMLCRMLINLCWKANRKNVSVIGCNHLLYLEFCEVDKITFFVGEKEERIFGTHLCSFSDTIEIVDIETCTIEPCKPD
eukprot:755758_1